MIPWNESQMLIKSYANVTFIRFPRLEIFPDDNLCLMCNAVPLALWSCSLVFHNIEMRINSSTMQFWSTIVSRTGIIFRLKSSLIFRFTYVYHSFEVNAINHFCILLIWRFFRENWNIVWLMVWRIYCIFR